MADSTTAEDIAMALGAALVRKGLLDASDLADAADGAERDGLPDTAHALRLIAIEAGAPSASDWEAGQRRGQMRIVKD